MTTTTTLDRLCALAGIGVAYDDAWGRRQNVGDETKRALLAALGIACESADEIDAAIADLDGRDWRRPLPPVLVLRQSEGPPQVPITLPNAERGRLLRWTLTPEDGAKLGGEVEGEALRRIDARRIDQTWFVRAALPLPAELALGYHRFELAAVGEKVEPLGAMRLIVVPDRCYEPQALTGERRVWGAQVQLYSLRSERNWGIGDLSDLRRLVEFAGESGAAAIGVNPLHALFPDNPENASPYGPSSRSRWNPLYLDVEAVPDFAECAAARELVHEAEFQALLRALRASELVDYAGVAAAKSRVLERLFAHFCEQHLTPRSPRGRDFEAFCGEGGEGLLALARFEALQEHFRRSDPSVWGWPVWPESYRVPDSTAVAEFCRAHAERVQYRQYLQWESDRQLGEVGRRSAELGLGVGLYLDLAVGVDRGGAEVWANRGRYVLNAGVGAPPDVINQQGQDWGLPPLNPQTLRDDGYAPFIAILRANMHHAGGLRIDHVMGLMRQFWVPQGRPPGEGAYVAYPFADLLGILALESQRNQCVVIGEDLGTVPDEVRQAQRPLGIYSCRPLLLEHGSSGDFIAPADYPAQALVSVGTHDLPTLRAYWLGHDLELRAALDVFPSPEVRESQVLGRSRERAQLLIALDREELLPAGVGVDPAGVHDMTPELCRAIHVYLARSASRLMMVAPEDILGEIEQMNLPGTTAERHPNWRRKLALNLEAWREDSRLMTLAEALRAVRGGSEIPALDSAFEGGAGAAVGSNAAAGADPGNAPANPAQVPLATYRLQLNHEFTLAQATEFVPYWHELGVSHCYTSPCLKARPGSNHGYDITDHSSINPEVGNAEDLERFVAALHARDMGQIIDVVPNHMGVLGGDNAWWQDVLENGQASAFAGYFDIEWLPLRAELRGKVLLPVLGDQYGRVLDAGELKLAFDAGRGELSLHYYQHRFPIDPRQYPRVLGRGSERLAARLEMAHAEGPADPAAHPHLPAGAHPDHLELQSLITAFAHLPAHTESAPEQVAERARDKEIHKQRLAELVARSADVALFIDENVAAVNGTPGNPESWDELHALIKEQAWRLAYWRVASDDINYRRFFDINDLAALHMESETVFEQTHRLVFDWIKAGFADGLRIDHPDGLFDPAQYFDRLQRRAAELGVASPLYVVAEKILAGHEHLPSGWAIAGSTGYGFANVVNGLFIDAANERSIDRIYAAFIGEQQDFADLAYRAKKLIVRSAMAGELNVLASQLSRIALGSRYTCDFTVNSLRESLAEIVAAFPVYRTYITAGQVAEDDRRHIDWAVATAKKRRPPGEVSVFDFVRDVLTGAAAVGKSADYAAQVFAFAMRFQQYTAPVTAKGVEDTGFYRYNRLISLNEVGGDPRNFGTSVAAFHHDSQDRAQRWPHALLATSTHDSKRSEDVRARLDVLSEIPLEWVQRLRRWRRLNRGHKQRVSGQPAPSRNDEYLLYQTLLGVWPLEAVDADGLAALHARVAAAMLKAAREAKSMTSWLNPDTEYEQALAAFIAGVLGGAARNLFLADFLPFQQRVARFGLLNSLSQTLIKLTSPGVPDIYQGNEVWQFNLVDPDNRQPVDFGARQALLREIASSRDLGGEALAEWAGGLLATIEDGRAKLYVTWRSLHLRRDRPEVFQGGDYLPLRTGGARADHVCAFARRGGRHAVIVIAPRLFVRLMGEAQLPLGVAVWQETWVELPAELAGMRFSNLLTGEALQPEQRDGKAMLLLASALARFPLALYCDVELE